ncbi:MAG: GspH/FimT family pseudopilin [gamma proteobacterium symbiont of Bathyaustriella thionipta]|nr:GspH/FimT family pseudopilin [gamma proteobacterium symbiont of Bathyaustriella thionipta]
MSEKILFKQRQQGFSLLELLISMAIFVILMSMVMPAMSAMVAQNKMSARVNGFVSKFHMARSNAISSGINTVVCPSLDQSSCENSFDWSEGLIIFADSNNNRQRDVDEPLIHVWSAQQDDIRIVSSSGRRKTIYHADGRTPGTNLTIKFCPRSEDDEARAIVISNNGRLRLDRRQAVIDCSS